MAVTKKSVEGEQELEAAADVAKPAQTRKAKRSEQDVKAFVYEGEEDLVTLSVGGTNYDFRKGAPVYLPPGQSPNHPDVHEVKE